MDGCFLLTKKTFYRQRGDKKTWAQGNAQAAGETTYRMQRRWAGARGAVAHAERAAGVEARRTGGVVRVSREQQS